jgi:hypothetical protein
MTSHNDDDYACGGILHSLYARSCALIALCRQDLPENFANRPRVSG